MTSGPRSSGDIDPAVYTRRRLLVAGAAVVVPAILYSQFLGRNARPNAPPTASDPAPPSIIVDASTIMLRSDSAVPATTRPTVTFDHDVGPGVSGSKVAALQDRLRQLGFDPGPTDAVFGQATRRAVWAFEKFFLDTNFDAVTGTVTPDMWLRMNEPIEVRPRRSSPGTHLELLLLKQVAVLYENDTVRLITHISSGTGQKWCAVVTVDNDDGTQTEHGICGVAVTPGGVFHFERRFDGWRNSKLGRLYNPVYFNYGIAVHGASNVPAYPASHGCVRIPMHIAEYFPSLVRDGDLVYVFDGIDEPETYGAQLPVFDYPDPNYTTTTTTTTTTATTTTTTATTSTVVPTTTRSVSTVPDMTHEHSITTTTTAAAGKTSTTAPG